MGITQVSKHGIKSTLGMGGYMYCLLFCTLLYWNAIVVNEIGIVPSIKYLIFFSAPFPQSIVSPLYCYAKPTSAFGYIATSNEKERLRERMRERVVEELASE